MVKYTCSECSFEVVADEGLSFCPKCGVKFGTTTETTRLVTTDEGESIMTIDRKAFAIKDREENTEKYTSEWYSREMRDPNSPYYIPPSAVQYEDDRTGRVISHQETRIVLEEDIAKPIIKEVEIPEGTVAEEHVDTYITEITEYVGGEREVKKEKLITDSSELIGDPKPIEEVKEKIEQLPNLEKVETEDLEKSKIIKPKFSEIIKMDLSLEERAALAKKWGYADSTIKRWLQKVAAEREG
jgi:uncharacterized Zn finger protein (UPF0148 family)